MARVLLGTGTGIAAAAAVYYTLSTSLADTTEHLRADLHSASSLLASSLSPATPPAASAALGAPYPYTPPFSLVVRQRWNHAVSSALAGARETDWAALAAAGYAGARQVAARVTGAAEGAVRDVRTGEGVVLDDEGVRVESKVEGLSPAVEVRRKAEAAPRRLV